MKKILILALSFIFCVLAYVLSQKNDSIEMNIASFNVGFCRAKEDIARWENRKSHIMRLVNYHDFDIVGMQEPFGFQVEYLKNASDKYAVAGKIVYDLKYSEIEKFSPTGRENIDRMLRNMNNPIFYKRDRFDVLADGKFYFSETPDIAERGFGKSFDSIRSCVWIKFREKKSGIEFFVFNIHFCVGKYSKYHEPSAKLLLKKIEEITKNSPFFITGDFNENKSGEASTVLRESGLVDDSREISATPPYGISKCSFNDYNLSPKEGLPIDFIYVSKGILVQKFATLSDHADGTPISDHYPIVARVELNTAKK